MLRLVNICVFAVACSKGAPPEGTQLLDKTRAAVDAVCACGTDAACRTRELAKYEAIVAEAGTTSIGAAVVDELAKQAERVATCTK